jgi:chromosome segregation ATPase
MEMQSEMEALQRKIGALTHDLDEMKTKAEEDLAAAQAARAKEASAWEEEKKALLQKLAELEEEREGERAFHETAQQEHAALERTIDDLRDYKDSARDEMEMWKREASSAYARAEEQNKRFVAMRLVEQRDKLDYRRAMQLVKYVSVHRFMQEYR